ncbi:sensor histidine kinase [Streptomyces iconiensis]|uniref:histidine kinase n=1 Tax=Streptomyces iconiensis TaxID=1384038 RepID=A0ABT6ZQN9_9ACTN|nr:sensor histidine kinase [Streptomyces iconiensis]MDJ1131365.1 sensor histidine kinase [Streptomyces iconiensis]
MTSTRHPSPGPPGRPPWGPPGRRWLARPPAQRALPWVSSLVVLVFQHVGSGFASHGQLGDRLPLDGYARALLTAGPLLLLVRQRYPRTAVFGTAVIALGYLVAGYPYGPVLVSVAVAGFSAIAAGHRHVTWGGLGGMWAGHLLLVHVLYRWLPPEGDGPSEWGQDLVMLAWMVAVCSAAELARVRRAERARWLREAEEAEQRRADEERLRIARELHDVLAHSISVINVQAGVGLALLDSDRDQARTALTTIKAASKEALGEVRQVLDTLRAPGDAPRTPAPGLDRLPELTEQAAAAGLQVTAATEGKAAPLPPGVDLAAFRIIQEALTNVVRHSGSRTARVRVVHGAGGLELYVDDEGPATGDGPSGGGNGLVGMRERAAAFGGSVEAGPRGDGGFRVRATIPLRPIAGPGPGSDPAPGPGSGPGLNSGSGPVPNSGSESGSCLGSGLNSGSDPGPGSDSGAGPKPTPGPSLQ